MNIVILKHKGAILTIGKLIDEFSLVADKPIIAQFYCVVKDIDPTGD